MSPDCRNEKPHHSCYDGLVCEFRDQVLAENWQQTYFPLLFSWPQYPIFPTYHVLQRKSLLLGDWKWNTAALNPYVGLAWLHWHWPGSLYCFAGLYSQACFSKMVKLCSCHWCHWSGVVSATWSQSCSQEISPPDYPPYYP